MHLQTFNAIDVKKDLTTDSNDPINSDLPLSNFYFAAVIGRVCTGKTYTGLQILKDYWDKKMITTLILCMPEDEKLQALTNKTIKDFLHDKEYSLLTDIISEPDWLERMLTTRNIIVANDPVLLIKGFIKPLSAEWNKRCDKLQAVLERPDDWMSKKELQDIAEEYINLKIKRPLHIHVLFDDCIHDSCRPVEMNKIGSNPFYQLVIGRRHARCSIMCTIHEMTNLKRRERKQLTDIILCNGVSDDDIEQAHEALSSWRSLTPEIIENSLDYLKGKYENIKLLSANEIILKSDGDKNMQIVYK